MATYFSLMRYLTDYYVYRDSADYNTVVGLKPSLSTEVALLLTTYISDMLKCGHYNTRWSVCFSFPSTNVLFKFIVGFVESTTLITNLWIFIYKRLIICHQTRVPHLREFRQRYTGGRKTSWGIDCWLDLCKLIYIEHYWIQNKFRLSL